MISPFTSMNSILLSIIGFVSEEDRYMNKNVCEPDDVRKKKQENKVSGGKHEKQKKT